MAIDEVYHNWTITYDEFPMFMKVMVHAYHVTVVVIDALNYDEVTPLYAITFLVSKRNDGWLATCTPGTFNQRYLFEEKICRKSYLLLWAWI